MSVTLSRVTLFNQSAAGDGDAVPVDYIRGGGTLSRNVMTNVMNSADTVNIQGSIDGATWITLASHTGGAGPFSDVIVGPWAFLRVSKTGAAGTATVIGLV